MDRSIYELIEILQSDDLTRMDALIVLETLEFMFCEEATVSVLAALVKFQDDEEIVKVALATLRASLYGQLPSVKYLLKELGLDRLVSGLMTGVRIEGWGSGSGDMRAPLQEKFGNCA